MKKFVYQAFVLGLCVVAVIWVARRPTADVPSTPNGPALPKVIVPKVSLAELRAKRDEFFKVDVEPLIQKADNQNREAAKRCIERLGESFEGYRRGVRPFSEEINTWGTRLGVIRLMPGDYWYEKTDVGEFIQKKFAKHLFSDQTLKRDIRTALAQFREDVSANQNAMIVKIRASVSDQDIPGLAEIDYSVFAKDLSTELNNYSTQTANDSVVRGIVIEIASGIGGYAAEQLLVQIISKLSTSIGAAGAMAGGATAGSTAAGAGGGTLGGPLGVAAGIGGGLVVGVIIDWWMSSNFEEKMVSELNGLIDEIKTEVIAGDIGRPGLREGLRGSCDVMRQAYQKSLRVRIVDGEIK